MTTRTLIASSVAGLACALGSASADHLTTFDFGLDGSQEVPGNTSTSFGDATLIYDSTAMTFDLGVTTQGIAFGDLLGVGPNSTPIHLHMAPAGANGGIVVDLGLVGSFMDDGGGQLSFSVQDVAIGGPQGAIGNTDPVANEMALFAGNLYLNIHTGSFPAGEIRGQVVPAPASAGALALCGVACARRRRR